MDDIKLEDSIDIKDIFLMNPDPKEEDFVLCAEYVDSVAPMAELPIERNDPLESTGCHNVNNGHGLNVIMSALHGAMKTSLMDIKTEPNEDLHNELDDVPEEEYGSSDESNEKIENVERQPSLLQRKRTSKKITRRKGMSALSKLKRFCKRSVENTIYERNESIIDAVVRCSPRLKDKPTSSYEQQSLDDYDNDDGDYDDDEDDGDDQEKNKEPEFHWTCCDMHFNNYMTFSEHKDQCHNITEVECSVCGEDFVSVTKTECHYMQTHYKDSLVSFNCAVCNYLFGVQSSFYKHKNYCNEAEALSRQILGSIINKIVLGKSGERDTDISSDSSTDYYLVCCEETFTSFKEFNIHKFVKHKIEHLVCGLCYRDVKKPIDLYKHYAQVHCPPQRDIKLRCYIRDLSAQEGTNMTRSKIQLDSKDICSREKDDVSSSVVVNNGVQCTAEQEGILCQCPTCTGIVNNFLPSTKKSKKFDHTKPHVCKICKYRFSLPSKLKRHLKTHLGYKDFPCDLCGASFTKFTSLKNHKVYKHSSNPLQVKCDQCCKVFTCKSSLKKHIRNVHLGHGKTFRVPCTYCTKTFAQGKSLQRHINMCHSKKKEYICDHCGDVIYDKGLLIYHMQNKHLPPEDIVCDICGFVAKTKTRLYGHKNKTHSYRSYACEICGKVFRQKTRLEFHLITHTDEKPFMCQKCGKSFKREANLQQHQYVHSNERPHLCTVCGMTFRLRTHVKQHMAVHGGVKTRKCLICNELFAKKTELNAHIAQHLNPLDNTVSRPARMPILRARK